MSWALTAPEAPPGLAPAQHPPSISVVIPTWNIAHLVGDALRSLEEQTLLPEEVLVCDDGSSDDIAGAVAPFERSGALAGRVRLLRLPHRGAGATRNAGAKAATGDVVAFLDADDRYLPERVAALSWALTTRPDLVLVTTDAWMSVDGVRERLISSLRPFEVADQRAAILSYNYVFAHPAVRRQALLDAGGFDEDLHVGEDWVCWQRLLWQGGRFGEVSEPLAEYRTRPNSLTGDRGRYDRDRIRMQEAFRSLEMRPHERASLEHSLAHNRFKLAHSALLSRAPDVRRRSWDVVRDPSLKRSTRVKALVAVASPDVARAVLQRR